MKTIAEGLMSPSQRTSFERDLEMNFAVVVDGSGRFRVNVFKQRGEVALVIRAMKQPGRLRPLGAERA